MSSDHAVLDSVRRAKRLRTRRGGSSKTRWDSPIIGSIVAVQGDGTALVDFENNPAGKPTIARTCVALHEADASSAAVLVFAMGDATLPIIVGKLLPVGESADRVTIDRDGETISISAENQISLTCGKASITLTRAGKVLIRGAYVLSRSSGANRLKGGSVQIN